MFTPCATYTDETEEGKLKYGTFVFSRSCLSKPCLLLPSSKPSIAVRCNPRFFKNMDTGETIFDLGYRLIYAVASLDTVSVYDTQHRHPIVIISDAHYVSLTDIAWSSDGFTLVLSSADGYCSVAVFDATEFGPLLEGEELEKVLSPLEAAKKPRTRPEKVSL